MFIHDNLTKVCYGVYYLTSSHVIPCLINIHEAFNVYSHYPIIENACCYEDKSLINIGKLFSLCFVLLLLLIIDINIGKLFPYI